MASGKPAKRNVSNTTVSAPKIDDGQNVLYVGAGKSVFHKCPVCSRSTGKGIVREYKNELYCSRGCVISHKNKVEVNA
jgi:hypothetical protein